MEKKWEKTENLIPVFERLFKYFVTNILLRQENSE